MNAGASDQRRSGGGSPGAPRSPSAGRGQEVARRCLISGRVQGVYYRGSARQRARADGIVGYARNLPDGRVEVLACGEEAGVQRFIEWLWVGPAAAKVIDVAIEPLQLPAHQWPHDFETG